MSEHDEKQKAAAAAKAKAAEHDEKQKTDAEAKSTKADVDESAPDKAVDTDGATTKDDALDAGVDMLPGHASEPQGPEDAFGAGLKRGDYTDRVGSNHAIAEVVEGGGEPVYATDEDGNEVQVDVTPRSVLVDQVARAEEIGDEPGKKGGVTTTAA